MDPVTPGYTRVSELLGSFDQFMGSAQLQSEKCELDNMPRQEAAIPFDISDSDMSLSPVIKDRKRPHDSEDAIVKKAKAAQMELQHALNEKSYKLAINNLENRIDKMSSENNLLKDKVENLQAKLKDVTKQAIDAQNKFINLRDSKSSKSQNLEEVLSKVQTEKAEMESKLESRILDLEESRRDLQERNSHLTVQYSSLHSELSETKALLDQKNNRMSMLREKLGDLERAEKTVIDQKMKILDLEMRISRAEEYEKLAKVMKDDLGRLRQLEIEVVKLRDQNAIFRDNEINIDLMKEKMMATEEKMKRNEKLLEKYAVVELENKDLLQELNELRNREIQKSTESSSREELVKLRQQVAILSNEKGELQTEVTLLRKSCDSFREKISELEQSVIEKTKAVQTKEENYQSLHKRSILLKNECDGLKGILQSYDSEMMSNTQSEQLMKRLRNTESMNEKLHKQLLNAQAAAQTSSQERTVLQLKVKELTGNIATASKSSNSNDKSVEIESLKKKIEDLVSENKVLMEKNDHLNLWADSAKRRGDFDPRETKVFHFKMNPAGMAHKESKKELSELRQKCTKLEEKIFKLQSDQDVTTMCIDTGKIKELEEKLSISDLKNQRLKEVFSKKIQEFRRACYTLTGYRIDGISDNHFKLISRYAEKEHDFLLFSSGPGGVMQLLETEYSKTLESLIRLHLHHQNSIPMFLSSLTAELFSQQTIMM